MLICCALCHCRGYSQFKRGYLQSLLAKCDFLFLQEHWLSDGQLSSFSDVSDAHFATAVSGFSHEVLRGRPYGGCAIFWPRHIDAKVEMINIQSNRLCAIRVYNDFSSLLFVNVYMPCESSDTEYDEFCNVLSVVASIVDLYPNSKLILGGDFNVDFARVQIKSNQILKISIAPPTIMDGSA